MSKLNDVLEEMKGKLLAVETSAVKLTGRVVMALNEDDLIDLLKNVRSFPAIGVVYEGMRSMPESKPTANVGVSCEMVVAFVLIEQGDAVVSTDQKRSRAIDYLEAMRGPFMGKKSQITGHFWHFLVEAPAEVRSGMVAWVQRWSVPIQLPPTP